MAFRMLLETIRSVTLTLPMITLLSTAFIVTTAGLSSAPFCLSFSCSSRLACCAAFVESDRMDMAMTVAQRELALAFSCGELDDDSHNSGFKY